MDSVDQLSQYFANLHPFTPPSPVQHGSSIDGQPVNQQQPGQQRPIQSIMDQLEESNEMHMTSVLRKRKIKMRKHKYQKLRKRTRALRKKLGK
ncbi:hypothetical protein BG011_010185 [Mortierella polycephala]|uniref:Small ribosomal subunit protein mS38 n=1 Tax=Mortierella polycephala TaxID=41804 RepID=A0A9P6TVM9_9FUNG|nr:hypothetical protein BG011_010185 [Mortierella polycephala]